MANGLNTPWPWNTMMLIGLVILCVLYIIGIRQTHKGKDQNTHLKKRHIGAFIIAVVLMSLVFLTPLNTIARKQLFSAHMLPAVTLTTLCAPVGGAFLLLPGLVDLVVMLPLFFLWLAQIEQKTWIVEPTSSGVVECTKKE